MTVKSRSAAAMFAMKRFVTLVDREDFFNTTNKPRLLPNRAMMKITAYAVVIPILIFSGTMNGAGGAPVEFVPKKEIEKVYCFIFISVLSLFSRILSRDGVSGGTIMYVAGKEIKNIYRISRIFKRFIPRAYTSNCVTILQWTKTDKEEV